MCHILDGFGLWCYDRSDQTRETTINTHTTMDSDNNCFDESVFFSFFCIDVNLVDTNEKVLLRNEVHKNSLVQNNHVHSIVPFKHFIFSSSRSRASATKCINKSIWIIDCNLLFISFFILFSLVTAFFCRIICIFCPLEIHFMFPDRKK